jgi:hypothetical protein
MSRTRRAGTVGPAYRPEGSKPVEPSTAGDDATLATPEFSPEADTLVVEDQSLRYGFVQLPKQVLRARNLSRDAKLLYAVLLGYAWEEGRCFPGYARLCADMGASENAVRKYMRELQEVRLLSQKRRGLGKTNLYRLHDLRAAHLEVQEPQMSRTAQSEVPDSTRSTVTEVRNGEVQGPPETAAHEQESEKQDIHEQQPAQVSHNHTTPDNVVVALTDIGITKSTARSLATEHREELIRTQIDMLPYRRAKDQAAVLVKAIREDWTAPVGYETPEQREAIARDRRREETALDAWRQMYASDEGHGLGPNAPPCRDMMPFKPFKGSALDSRQAWATALMRLRDTSGADAYLRGSSLLAREDGELVVGVSSAYGAEWLERRLGPRAVEALSAVGGEPVGVRFVAENAWRARGASG